MITLQEFRVRQGKWGMERQLIFDKKKLQLEGKIERIFIIKMLDSE